MRRVLQALVGSESEWPLPGGQFRISGPGSRLSIRSRAGCRRPDGAVGHAESYHESPCVESVGIIHAHISNPLTGGAPRLQILCIRIADLVFHA